MPIRAVRKPGAMASFVAFPLIICATVAAAVVFRRQLWAVFSSPAAVRATVDRWGAAAPIGFIALQILQVVIFVIPGEVPQIAGGYLFGIVGMLYSTIGIVIGSTINFVVARSLGPPFVRRLFTEAQIRKFDGITHSARAQIAFFLLFVIPGIPKDVLCYVAGLSPLRFAAFLAVSSVGRLPGIVGSTVMGHAAASSQWVFSVAVFAVSTLLFVFGLVHREKVHIFIERFALRGAPLHPAGDDRPDEGRGDA